MLEIMLLMYRGRCKSQSEKGSPPGTLPVHFPSQMLSDLPISSSNLSFAHVQRVCVLV